MELASCVSNDALVNMMQISCEHLPFGGLLPKNILAVKVTDSINAFNSKSTKIKIIGG